MSWLNTYAENIRQRDKRLGRDYAPISDRANKQYLKEMRKRDKLNKLINKEDL
jgi:hypothetical protein